jgi:hypothetical protein
MKLRKDLGKILVVLMATALVFGALPTLALAKSEALMFKGVEMMVKANEVLKGAVGTIQKGQKMYVQICQDKGCLTDVAKGNQMINDGLKMGGKGLTLLEEGQVQYKKAKGKNLQGAKAGAVKMTEGGKMVQDALNMISDGVKTNNLALEAKNMKSEVIAPSKTIVAGVNSGLTGIKQFLDGQKLFLQNK